MKSLSECGCKGPHIRSHGTEEVMMMMMIFMKIIIILLLILIIIILEMRKVTGSYRTYLISGKTAALGS